MRKERGTVWPDNAIATVPERRMKNTLTDLVDALYSFLEMRNTLKPKPTVKAMQLVLNKLDKITSDDSVKIQILENSIMNGWKGVFPLKTQQGERVNEPTYRIDQEGNKRDEFGCLIL